MGLLGNVVVDLNVAVVDLESGPAEDVEAEVAAAFGPFVVLFGEDGADEADQRIAVGKMPTTSVRRGSPGSVAPGGCWTRFDATAPWGRR